MTYKKVISTGLKWSTNQLNQHYFCQIPLITLQYKQLALVFKPYLMRDIIILIVIGNL
jgi:hypothetical protein